MCVCVCVCERERESVCVCVSTHACSYRKNVGDLNDSATYIIIQNEPSGGGGAPVHVTLHHIVLQLPFP